MTQNNNKIFEEIKRLAKDRFDKILVEQFVETFDLLSSQSPVIDFIIQISTDEGDELEIGFFNLEYIGDVTLSNGKIYSYSYPITSVNKVQIEDLNNKHVLKIYGEKIFDYNVMKPGSIANLEKYQTSLHNFLNL